MNLLLSRLDEQQPRWYLAVESQRLGHGADRLLFEITGVDEKTIRRGREELAASLAEQPTDRVRQPGGGRPPVEKNTADCVLMLTMTSRCKSGQRKYQGTFVVAR